MALKIEVWNTGRRYSHEGQVIAATEVEGGIVFADISRMIDGFVAASPERIAREGIRRVVMWGYDTGAPTDGGGFKYNYDWVRPQDRGILQEVIRAADEEIAKTFKE